LYLNLEVFWFFGFLVFFSFNFLFFILFYFIFIYRYFFHLTIFYFYSYLFFIFNPLSVSLMSAQLTVNYYTNAPCLYLWNFLIWFLVLFSPSCLFICLSLFFNFLLSISAYPSILNINIVIVTS
jgi:hypothetical protein